MTEWSERFPYAFVSRRATLGEDVEIGPGTVIHPRARIGSRCRIGPYCIIGEAGAEIGDEVTIGAYCEIGHPAAVSEGTPVVIGAGSRIRSHSVFYEGSSFGEGLVTGHRVTVRERTRVGKGFQLGTLSDVQGHCTIGNHVRTHSNVHVCHAAVIEDFVWIFPYVVLTNDPHPPSDGFRVGPIIRRFAVIATHACVMPAVEVGEDSVIAAKALVTKDVPAGKVVAGVPAKVICDVQKIELKDGSQRPAYPWRRHFHRGYPEEVVQAWSAEFSAGSE